MIYVTADIHGCLSHLKRLLEILNLSPDDILYVLGDVVDRGEAPIQTLRFCMSHPNIQLILGNHDYLALSLFRKIYIEKDRPLSSSEIKRLSNYLLAGGRTTKEQFADLPFEEQVAILNYIDNAPPYADITVGGKRFWLIHGGLGNFDKQKDLADYSLHNLISERLDYTKQYFDNRIIVSGHTPTFLIDEHSHGKIFRKNNHIAVDCGCFFTGTLGCICLDDFTEYYATIP